MPYTSRQYISALEKQGKQGDKILVEGIRAGSAKVSARIISPGFKVGYFLQGWGGGGREGRYLSTWHIHVR